MENKPTINAREISKLIYTINGKQVMLDRDLASLYQVKTKNRNRAVKKTLKDFRYLSDFNLPMRKLRT